MPGEIDLLTINGGMVIAPAGCGKTQLITDALGAHGNIKPILVLTHTNSGVAALKMRLDRSQVPANKYRLSTIDGWAIRLINMFPERAGHDPTIVSKQRPNYPAIREAAFRLLKSTNVSDVIAASYSRLLVDEYQDCSVRQHAVVYYAAKVLPTCVVGDPLQGIFDFSADDKICDWAKHACTHFPQAGELSTPWRWNNAGAPNLGAWLLEARKCLLAGQPVDLSKAPAEVTWIKLSGGKDDFEAMIKAGRVNPPGSKGSVLIVSDSKSPPTQQRVASAIPGAITVEAVDLRDLVKFAEALNLGSPKVVSVVAEFAESLMTNVGSADLIKRIETLQQGRARRAASEVEEAAMALSREPTLPQVLNLLVSINKEAGVRTYRPAILRGCIRALETASGQNVTFHEAAIRVREQGRAVGRVITGRAVGSTLTLKGLEADVAVVLDGEAHNTRNLYVAMTRGAKRLVICSRKAVLSPS